MTVVEIERALSESFSDKQGSSLPEMKNDFRRLEARFICECAIDQRHLCSNYRAGSSGDCSFISGSECLNREVYLDA